MYIEHPYFYEGKYYANIDGEMIEITKEVAYTLADPEKSVTGKPMNCWSLETRVSGLWSGACIRAGYYSLPAYAGVTIRGIEDK